MVAYSPLGRGILTGAYRSFDDLEDDDFRKQVRELSKTNTMTHLSLFALYFSSYDSGVIIAFMRSILRNYFSTHASLRISRCDFAR